MSITLKLYGKLVEKVKKTSIEKGLPATLNIEIGGSRSIFNILDKLKIKEKDISHIFLNGVYTGSGMRINDSDRIGVFPRNMALMFAEIPDLNSIHIKVNILADFKIYGRREFCIKFPKGSTLNSIIKKLNFPKQVPNHKILVNGKQLNDYNSIINADDTIEILPV
ncbi:MAG: hypothetical protein ACTSV5_04270 [Promethearchaeota archaeon]